MQYKTLLKHNREIINLLQDAKLSTGTIQLVNYWRVLYDGDTLIACGGLVIKGEDGYLQSLTVKESHRYNGIATQINMGLEIIANQRGVKTLYLMTTIQDCFVSRGFSVCIDSEIPPRIKGAQELKDICCFGCEMMRKAIGENLQIKPLIASAYPEIKWIYQQGINTGVATFDKEAPTSYEAFIEGKEVNTLIGYMYETCVLSWAVIAYTSKRKAYCGVGEVSIYTHPDFVGLGLGESLMSALKERSREQGFWTIQSSIISKNTGSIKLHQKTGFRFLGYREAISKISFGPYAGQWLDVDIYELRL